MAQFFLILILLFMQDLVVKKSEGSTCMTIRRKPCMFPFFYHGIAHYGCTMVDSIGKKPWCGYGYKGNITLWSFCNMKRGRCKVEKCTKCVTKDWVPCTPEFEYKGKVYNNCVKEKGKK